MFRFEPTAVNVTSVKTLAAFQAALESKCMGLFISTNMDSITIDFSQPTNGTALGLTSEREREISEKCESAFIEWMHDQTIEDGLYFMQQAIDMTDPQNISEAFFLGGCVGMYMGSNSHLIGQRKG